MYKERFCKSWLENWMNDWSKTIRTICFIIITILIAIYILGCKITPHPNYKAELTIADRIKAKQIKGCEPLSTLGSFGNYFSGYYNSKQFMHERYAQFNYSVPAITQFQYQLNKKTESWMLGKYGITKW